MHFQDGLKQRFWRTSRIVVALLVLFEISALQHFYYQNQQVSAIEPDIALLKKLKTERVPDATHTASLVFMGDIMLARGIGSSIDQGINPFAGVQEKLDEFDMRIANLETTLANPNIGSPASKPYTFNSSISALDTLKNARLDVASLANNHTGDFGRLATSDTVTQFKNAGLNTVGAGDNIEQAFKPLLIEKNGISLGFIAVNDIELTHTKVGMQTPGSAYFDRDLIKNSLRMRPDRIIVGECRDGAALDMLQAMNTGHDGSMTTTHANSPTEAVARLETLALMSGLDLPARAIREQIVASVDVVLQQTRFSDGSRRITHVTEVTGLEDGEFQLRDIFVFIHKRTGPEGEVEGEFRATGYLPSYLGAFITHGLITDGTYL